MNERRKPKAKRSGNLSAEDRYLWRHVNRETQPLKRRDQAKAAAQETGAFEALLNGRDNSTSNQGVKQALTPSPGQLPLRQPVVKKLPKGRDELLSHGSSAGLDRRNAERLNRGKMAIESTLDLHGMTQAQAHGALSRFILRSESRGLRCVLVITGKGLAKESGGVLRNQVPNWLNESGNRERIIAFNYAQQGHGGTGALYVLLKRRREK